MSMTNRARSIGVVSGPIRSALAQSTATRVRSSMSAGSTRSRRSRCMKSYSAGSGPSPARYMRTSLPSCPSASFVASSDPSASPSGFSWVTTRKRSCSRNDATTACKSLDVCIILGCKLVDQPAHPYAVLDGRIVLEGQLGGPLHPQFAREPRLQYPVCGLEPAQRCGSLLDRAENADVDRRVAEVGRGVDSGDRHEADPRILQLGQGVGKHLAHRLVHASHSSGHGPYSSECTHSPSQPSASGASSWRSSEGSWASSSATSACPCCSS